MIAPKFAWHLENKIFCQAYENDAFVNCISIGSVDDSSDKFSSTSLPEDRFDYGKIIYQEDENFLESSFSDSCDNETDTITSEDQKKCFFCVTFFQWTMFYLVQISCFLCYV